MSGAVDLRLDSTQVAAAVRGFTEEDANREDVFARAAWSTICEPGDGFAGALVSILGPAKMLHLLIRGLEFAAVEAELNDCGHSLYTLERFANNPDYLPEANDRWKSRLNAQSVLVALESIRQIGGEFLTPASSSWPQTLDDLEFHAPFGLWCRGRRELLDAELSMAIVGSRGVTDYGRRVTEDLTHAAALSGAVVISGGAIGVDAIAHQTALTTSSSTIAVLAGGVDRLYPSVNHALLSRMTQEGLVLSEVPPGVAPTKWRFLQRNRLIAVLGHSTLVTEANIRSGALSTARHAAALGRLIGAVPGPIDSPKSAGCNALIEGELAELISGPESLKKLLPEAPDYSVGETLQGLSSFETRALDAIGFSAQSIESICRESGLGRQEAKTALGQLEVLNLVVRRGADWARAQTNL